MYDFQPANSLALSDLKLPIQSLNDLLKNVLRTAASSSLGGLTTRKFFHTSNKILPGEITQLASRTTTPAHGSTSISAQNECPSYIF
jgi:hypothetical protein